MKTLGKLFLLLSFVVVGRWSRPNPPVIIATSSELTAPATHRSPNTNSSVVLVRSTAPADDQKAIESLSLASF
jgi:hypothetical protein